MRTLSVLLFCCHLASAQTTTVTATKDDGTSAATKKPAGSTVTYTNTITNTGSNAATNMSFADPNITNATVVPGSVHISPLAINDSYETIANTQITVGPSAGSGLEIYINSNVRSNDQTLNPPGGTDTSSIASRTNPSNGTLVSFSNATGAFTYLPNAGFVGTDTFTYTVQNDADNTLTDTATVSIVVKDSNPGVSGDQKVWYVKNDAAAGTGQSSAPFNTLAAAQTAAAAGDTIYVFTGNGTSSGQNAGVALKSQQRLIGQGVALTVPVQINGGAATTTLNAAGSQPRVDNTSGNGVSATDVIPAEIQGLSLSGSANAIDFTYTSGSSVVFSTCQIKNNTIFGAGAEGIDINKDGNYTLGLDIQNNTWNTAGTHTGHGIDILRPAGGTQGTVRVVFSGNNVLSTGANAVNIMSNSAVTITGFTGNIISGNTIGRGINCDSVIFDSDVATAGFQQVSGGATVVGGSGNGVGDSGIVLTNTSGDLSFTDLDVFADGGAALGVTAATAYTGSAGFRIGVAAGVGTFASSSGPAVDASTVQVNLPNVLVTSSGSGTSGTRFSDTDGSTFSATSTSSIATSNASATAFQVANATGSYTYNGTINTTAGKGVDLTNNTGATIAFTNTLTLSSGANAAFTATGGGTVSATGSGSTLTTTTATALNVANTTIGASGLSFRSISSNGAASGIVLNTTGSSGGLTVSGDGGGSNNGSGGTIQNSTGVGVSLTSAQNVSLNYMNITASGDDGIAGSGVAGFSMNRSNVTNNGNALNEDGVDFGGTGLVTPNASLSGTATITNSQFTGNYYNQFTVRKDSGTAAITMTGVTVNGRAAENNNNDGLFFESLGTATITGNVQNSTFSANKGDHFQAAGVNSGNLNVTFKTNTLTGGHSTALGQGITINAATGVAFGGYTGTVNYDIDGNAINGAIGPAITVVQGTSASTAVFNGFIRNNLIGTTGVALSGSAQANGIVCEGRGNGAHTASITGNTIRRVADRGIGIAAGDGSAVFNLNITGNTVTELSDTNSPNGTPREAIEFNLGITSTNVFSVVDAPIVRVNLSGNSLTGGAFKNGDIRMRKRMRARVEQPAYGGAASDTAAVITYLQGNNAGTTATCSFTDDPGAAVTTDGYFATAGAVPSPTATPLPLLFAESLPESTEDGLRTTQLPLAAGSQEIVAVVQTGRLASNPPADTSKTVPAGTALSRAHLQKLVAEAKSRWEATGLTPEQTAALEALRFEISDLATLHLGQASGDLIQISRTAAGNQWFIDPTPDDDSEFSNQESGIQNHESQVDLLTTLMHEMGHRLGLQDTYDIRNRKNIMFGFLSKGERRAPVHGQAAQSAPLSDSVIRYLDSPITIASLPAGKSVTIKYSVTVNNNPLVWVGASLSSQATVSTTNGAGTNGYFPSVVTNDPETPAANDATVTLLDRPDAAIVSLNRASSNPRSAATATWQIVFDQAVDRLAPSQFALVQGGSVTGAAISSVTETAGPPSTTWNISASTGTGDGTLGLNFINDTNLTHEVTSVLPFGGQVYTIDKTPPSTTSFARLTPLAQNTNADSLVFRVTFSENVTGVDVTDFTVSGTTATVTSVSGSGLQYDVTVSGGDLANLNGTVGLNFNSSAAADFITDLASNNLPKTEPATDETYLVDNTAPTVAMTSATSNPAVNAAIPVTVTFNENVTGFIATDITPANASVQNFAGSGSVYTFDLVPSGPGVTATADIAANVANDAAGNGNTAATQFSRTIVDAVSIAATTATAVEGGATGLYTFTRGSSTGALTVNFQLDASSTVTATSDFTLSSSQALSFNTGTGAGTIVIPNGSLTATLTLTALAEAIPAAEATETARLNVTTGTGYVPATSPNDNATVSITQNGFLVTTTADSGTGSLRQAILNANSIAGTDTITFSDGTGGTTNFTDSTLDTITLTSGEMSISSAVVISGTGTAKLAVSGNAASRIFLVNSGANLTLDQLTLTNGRVSGPPSPYGGAVRNFGTLQINRCVLSGNYGQNAGGAIANENSAQLVVIGSTFASNVSPNSGGAVYNNNNAQATIIDSTFTGNSATGPGNGGGIYSSFSTLTLVNSTVSGNTADGSIGGGGLYCNGGSTTLTNCTVTGNSMTSGNANAGGGGIQTVNSASVTLNNTIVIGNTATISSVSTPSRADCAGYVPGVAGIYTGNYALTGAGTGGPTGGTNLSVASASTVINTTLADNGGPTQTHALLAGSPALNAGSNALLPADTFDLDGDTNTAETIPFDQRGTGFARAVGTVDIGAFELQKSVSISPLAAVVNEGTGAGTTAYTFTVSRLGETTGDVTVDYAVSGAAVNAADFGGTLPASQVTITSGNASTTLTINVSKDALAELNEDFTVTLSNPNNGYILTGATASGTINNDDLLFVGIDQASGQADPSNTSPINFTVVFSEPVTDFDDAADVTLGGTALPTTRVITGGPTTYNVAVSGMTAPGTVTATIPAAAVISAGSAPNVASASADNSVTFDTIAPDTTITGNPTNPSASTSATFSFTGSDTGTGVARFETRLDSGPFATATSPQGFTGLPQGSHTFQVRAVDAAGNVDPTPASYTWVVDSIAPDTTITSNPPALSNSSSASFTFTGSDAGGTGVVSFQASLDGGGFSTATSPLTLTGLADGPHTVAIRSVDAAGNADATPASYTWTIDTTPPPAPVVVTPANGSVTNNPLPAASGTAEPLSSITVIIDGSLVGATSVDSSGNWSFTTPTPLADGAHTIRARATDAAGNTSVDSNTNTFTVDTVEPDTAITGNPPNPSNSTSATFTFTGNGTGSAVARFETSLDGAAFATATSPQSLTGLANGSHTFRVRTVDAAGNVDSSPASYTWTVDTVPPDVTLSTPAANPAPNALFTVTAQFSEAMTGFIAGDISVANAALSNFNAVDADTYTFDLTPNGPGLVVTVDIAANVAQDTAGNGNTAATQLSRTIIDAVSITATTATAVEGGATGLYTFTRTNTTSELVVDFQLDASSTASAADYSLSGGNVSFDSGIGSVTIPAGQASVALTLTANAEADVGSGQAAEPSETIRLNVVPRGTDYTAGTPNNSTVTITQNGFVVVNTNDSGEGSLRQAVLNANAIAGDDTITFEGSTFTDATADTIDLQSRLPALTTAITIEGNGARLLTIRRPGDAPANFSILSVEGGAAAVATISGVTITGGNGTGVYGGAILVDTDTSLTLRRCAVVNNSSNGSDGGAIRNSNGKLIILDSTISGNAGGFGGAIFSATVPLPGDTTSSYTLLINTTLSGNTSTGAGVGGGIRNRRGLTQLVNCTITGNTAGGGLGGGVATFGDGTADTRFSNTLVVGNSPSDVDYTNSSTNGNSSLGGNLIGTGNSGANFPGQTTTATLSTILGPLADNGGPTDTHMLFNGSPAINNGLTANLPADTFDLDGDSDVGEAIPFDQRGNPNLRTRGPAPDSGAFEAFAFEPTITAAATEEDVTTSSGLVITANTADGGLTTHYQISGILNGSLFQADGTTVINDGDFITVADGGAGLKFQPNADFNDFNTPAGFGFTLQAAVGGTVADLRGATVETAIPVASIADVPSVTGSSTIVDQQTTSGLELTINSVDGSDVTVFQITNIQNGVLYQTDGTTQINDGDFITAAQGGAGLKFTPDSGFTGTASFDVQAALDNAGTGLSAVATALIDVQHPVPDITVLGPLVLNVRTGLFEHRVRVSNPHSIAMDGFRLSVVNMLPDIILWNRTHPYLPVIEDFVTLGAGESREVLVQYYNSGRAIGGWVPEYEVENLSSGPDPLPGSMAGLWHGLVERSPDVKLSAHANVGARVEMTITAKGYVTGVLTEGITRRPFSGRLTLGPDSLVMPKLTVRIPRTALTLDVDFDQPQNTFFGFLRPTGSIITRGPSGAFAYGWRKIWKTSPPVNLSGDYKGRHNFGLENIDFDGPQGFGYGSATVSGTDGSYTLAGRLPDGSVLTGSSFVGPQGQLRVYKPLYANKGSVLGVLVITPGTTTLTRVPPAPEVENYVDGDLDWMKPAASPASTDRVYKAGFGPVRLYAWGGRYQKPTAGQLVMGLSAASAGMPNAGIDFYEGGLDLESEEFSQWLRVFNPSPRGLTNSVQVLPPKVNSVAFSEFSASTGVFTGTFRLPAKGPVPARTVTFRGQMVPGCGCTLGFGYFLLPQVPVPPQTLSNTPKLSGRVEFYDDTMVMPP